MTAARSWLFVPGTRPDRFDRALRSGADRVIIDLEDAVSPGDKEQARANVAAWLAPDHPVFVRVNGGETSWFTDDLAAICRPGLAGIVCPKAEDRAVIRQLAHGLTGLEGATIVPIIETALGLWRMRGLAGSSPRVERLALGTLDLALDLGMSPGRDEQELMSARMQIVVASRVAGVEPPIDSVTPEIDDVEKLRAASASARRFGFAGKLAIHPRQIPVIHDALTPAPGETAWARRIMAAAQSAGSGVVKVDDVMIDRPLIERARRILQAVLPDDNGVEDTR